MGLQKDLTEVQEKAIAELRNRLKHDLPKDMCQDSHMFYKFLKARNFNTNQAEFMLRKHLEFRKIMQIDTILTDYKAPEVCSKYLSQNFLGFDKEGRPVYMAAIGNVDSRGVFRSANKVDILKCCLYVIETSIQQLKSQTKKLGKPVTQCIYIYDMDKMTLARATDKYCLQFFLIGVSLFQDNYPELLKKVYVINASLYFTMVFPVIKTILAGSIIDKLRIFGHDGWKEALLEEIDADVLPACLGGTRTDSDGNPECRKIINWAGQVPQHYYLTKDIEKFAQQEGVKRALILKQSSFKVEIEIKHPGSVIEYEFETKCHDIGFQIMFEEMSSAVTTVKEIISMYKLETEYYPMKGSVKCERQGKYIIIFNNTYSWFSSKEVYYRMWTKTPDEKRTLLS